MYNVSSALKNDQTGPRTFIMTAPLGSLGLLLGCHRDALVRIESQLASGMPEASLHMNGRGPFPHLVFFVSKSPVLNAGLKA
jgi:hypothetical protein